MLYAIYIVCAVLEVALLAAIVAVIVTPHLDRLVTRWHEKADATGGRLFQRANRALAARAWREVRRVMLGADLVRRFTGDREFATAVMGTWADRVSQTWGDTAEAVAEGAGTWTYYDARRSVFALRQVLAFRAKARLRLVHCWLFGVADRLTLRLGVARQPSQRGR